MLRFYKDYKVVYILFGGIGVLFKDFEETKKVYHIVDLYDLESALKHGIQYNNKITYNTKYKGFHSLIEKEKTKNIPAWVRRKKAIFASMNYDISFQFHPNSVVLGFKIDPERCWVANENLANQIYAPFIMKDIMGFNNAVHYIEGEGKELLKKYWETSLSFEENLLERRDFQKDYNAEVLVLHDIPPENIEIEYIVSGHEILIAEQWKKKYC